jgi:hypothetical protein
VIDVAGLIRTAVAGELGVPVPFTVPSGRREPPSPFAISSARLASFGWRVGSVTASVHETVRFCLAHEHELRAGVGLTRSAQA